MASRLEDAPPVERYEFGRKRSVCGCRECVTNCEHMPAYMIPADLSRIEAAIDPHGVDLRAIDDWIDANLAVSPGAIVGKEGRVFRVRTLVPDRKADGSCVFLTPDKKCSIHSYSPFGCAFFDTHASVATAASLSAQGLGEVIMDEQAGGLYSRAVSRLEAAGRIAPSPEEGRKMVREAWEREQGDSVGKEEA